MPEQQQKLTLQDLVDTISESSEDSSKSPSNSITLGNIRMKRKQSNNILGPEELHLKRQKVI
jgi:hypothetical protein